MPLMPISLTLSLLMTFQAPGRKDDWRPFAPPGKGFKVSMPGEPTLTSDERPDLEMNIVSYQVDLGDQLYQVAILELKKAIPMAKVKAVLENSCKGMANGVNGTVVSLNPVKGDGLEGYEVLFDWSETGRPSVGRGREFLVGSRIYVLAYLGKKGTADREEVKNFLDSFKLTEPEAKSVKNGGTVEVAAAGEWRPFTPDGMGFTASMPGDPKEESHELEPSKLKVTSYTVNLSDRSYVAVCYDFAKIAQESGPLTTQDLCKDLVAGQKGTVITNKTMRVGALTAREVFYDFATPKRAKPMVGRAHAFIVGTRGYVLTYSGPKGTTESEEVAKFLDSFKVSRPSIPPKGKAKARP